MPFEIVTTADMGFCQGVRRAIERVTEVTGRKQSVETLGALVHNRQVQQQLDRMGARVVEAVPDIQGDTVVISAHGVGPDTIEEIRSRNIGIIDTTCPYVARAQQTALKLHQAGFYLVVYGDAGHTEVKGILGWAGGQGMATLGLKELEKKTGLPPKLGILSQTTQVPSRFAAFVASIIDSEIFLDAELRVVDTICHDSRRRQSETLQMARQCDLVFIIGGRHSANTRHLKELCETVTRARLIETADEIDVRLLAGMNRVGVTAGASTDDQTIQCVIDRLGQLARV